MTPPAPALAPPLVLIVEDNEKNLKLARDVLRLAGFRTLQARSGAEAVELAAAHVPDVILMDLRLPDMDGTDAARQLREAPRTAPIPIVALSAQRLATAGDRLLSAGFVGFVEKPFDVDEFPNQVRRFCVRATA